MGFVGFPCHQTQALVLRKEMRRYTNNLRTKAIGANVSLGKWVLTPNCTRVALLRAPNIHGSYIGDVIEKGANN